VGARTLRVLVDTSSTTPPTGSIHLRLRHPQPAPPPSTGPKASGPPGSWAGVLGSAAATTTTRLYSSRFSTAASGSTPKTSTLTERTALCPATDGTHPHSCTRPRLPTHQPWSAKRSPTRVTLRDLSWCCCHESTLRPRRRPAVPLPPPPPPPAPRRPTLTHQHQRPRWTPPHPPPARRRAASVEKPPPAVSHQAV
jgi:hypothetical protein